MRLFRSINGRSATIAICLLVLAAIACSHGVLAHSWEFRGVTLATGGQWTPLQVGKSTSSNHSSTLQMLENIRSLGATHVSLIPTWYQDFINSTLISPMMWNRSRALATEADDHLRAVIAAAHSAGLKVMISPIVDLNWDLDTNRRGNPPYPGAKCLLDVHASCPGSFVNRSFIGCAESHPANIEACRVFSAAQWVDWFGNYSRFLLHYAQIANETSVDMLCVGSRLHLTFQQYHWKALLSSVRSSYSGKLTVSADLGIWQTLSQAVWSGLDFIGTTGYDELHPENNTVEDLVTAWSTGLSARQALSKRWKKVVLVTEVGYQSRPRSWLHPPGMSRPRAADCSVWRVCYSMKHQALAYGAFLEAFEGREWYAGCFWWLWNTDPSAGGNSDNTFTTYRKPAEEVLRMKWQGSNFANTFNPTPGIGGRMNLQDLLSPAYTAQQQSKYSHMENGIVFGSGEWSYPTGHLNSKESFQSLMDAVDVGANSVQFIPTWHFENTSSTDFHRAGNASFLRTPTDAELVDAIRFARSKGLNVSMSLMLDPDYDEESNYNSSGNYIGQGRGRLGAKFTSAEAEEWFKNYNATILHYANLSEGAGATTFTVGHELYALLTNPEYESNWRSLIKKTRAVFSGLITAAFNGNPIFKNVANDSIRWFDALDSIGLDCYWPLKTQLPEHMWQTASVDEIVAAWQPLVTQLEQISKENNNAKIVCTEIGYQSRPYSWIRGLNQYQPDPNDCSVWSQCVNTDAQVVAYESFFRALYDQPWFGGVYWWVWRADPTAGGPSDDSYTPQHKDALQVLRKWWKGQGTAV